MPISCHFWDCKAPLSMCSSWSSAVIQVLDLYLFTFVHLPLNDVTNECVHGVISVAHKTKFQLFDCQGSATTYYPAPGRGTGYCFRAISFFLSFFLCLFISFQQHYEKTAGPICMKFSGKVWSDHGTTWLHFGSIRVNTARCRDANFFVSNITRKRLDRFAWNFQGRCGVTMGRPDYILGQFG